jgi:hypothetical protein
MHPSPAPKIIRRRKWPWVIGGLSLGVITLTAIAASYPRWADRIAAERIERTLEQKLRTDVTIGGIELDYTTVVLSNVTLASPDATFARVTVRLAENPLLAWGVEVERVDMEGGGTAGTAAEFKQLARRLQRAASGDRAGGSWLRRRMRLMPERLSLVDFEVTATRESGPVRAVWGTAEVTARPRDRAATLRLDDVRAELAGGKVVTAASVQTSLDIGRGSESPELRGPFRLDVEGAATKLTDRVSVGAVSGTITVADAAASSLAVDLSGGFVDEAGDGEAGLWSLEGEGQRDLSEGKVLLQMEPFELGRVPQVLAKLPVVDSERATVSGRVELVLGGGKIEVEGELELDGLNIEHPVLSRDVVRDVGFGAAIRATVDPEESRVDLEQLEIRRGDAAVQVDGVIVHPPQQERRRYSLTVAVPPTDCQDVLGAIPADLAPSLQGFVVEGTYDAKVQLEVDYSRLDELDLDTKVRADKCKVKRVPAALDAPRLRRGFTHRVTMRDGRNRRVQLFTGSGSYTPITAISPSMVGAVLTTEDGGFWRHRGFLPSQFETALRRNLKEGRVALGASTISMQMVKNVFLSHERTISRKLQEIILTAYVERVLSKERIMELYLNVIEFGPGVYGVTAAASHYFGKYPADLTSLEAAYLALMLPSPVRRHAYYCRGELTPRFEAKLRRIHKLMVDRGRIPEEEYYLWKESPLVFDPLRVVNAKACLAEIDALMEASAGQRALSGLLGDGAADDFDKGRSVAAERATEEALEPPEPRALPDVGDEPGGDAGDRTPTPPTDPANSDAPGVPAMDRP